MTDSRSDEQLMAAYVAGDLAAFQAIFARYAPLLTRAMLRGLYVREEANDLVQQTFLHLHRARNDFDLNQKLKPWLFTIGMNLKREYFRRSKRKPEISLELGSAMEPVLPSAGIARVEARLTLAQALSNLPPDRREVIELHWFDGLDFPEVAIVVGASVSAVKVRAHRGYLGLRKALGDIEGGEPHFGSGDDSGNGEPSRGI